MYQQRTIKNIIEPQFVMEGSGVRLQRSIAPLTSNRFDPFLLFDHFTFSDRTEGTNTGFPMHPHRGIETVTYILDGSVCHRDSLGNSGTEGPGDVQWMTSGGGILHEEFSKPGKTGDIYGFQLWVNLPACLKMAEPRYQEVKAADIPTIEKDGANIRVVAGEIFGVCGNIVEIAALPSFLDIKLAPEVELIHKVPFGHTALAYVFEGKGIIGDRHISSINMIHFNDGDHIRIQAEKGSFLRFILMTGTPFKEPIVPYGAFVMNSVEEIQQALVDLRNGTFVK